MMKNLIKITITTALLVQAVTVFAAGNVNADFNRAKKNDKLLLAAETSTSSIASGSSEKKSAQTDTPPASDLYMKGDAKCTACHDEADGPGLLAIGKTRHGTQADNRTPTCTSCHGASTHHLNDDVKDNKRSKPDRTFDKNTSTSAANRNEACLSCHQQDEQKHLWMGSAHETHEVACTSCHKLHTAHDAVRDKRTQPEVCFNCHKEQRAQVNKQSHHPVLEGKVVCSDCHNVHGSAGPKLMKRDSVVETCYTCHLEKRGPFVHNHQPVNEDCSTCHQPHGTTSDSMLKARVPMVCYQCHSGAHGGIPGIAGIAGGITTAPKANTFLLQGRGCLNCHTEIHGSNNPNGGQNLLPPAYLLR